MKKLICITGIILISCVCISTIYAPSTMAETNTEQQSQQTSVQTDIFIIKSENNRIVVYKKGESTPYITTDTLTSGLPKGDILQLQQGIEVKGESKLKKSLEDYCS